MSHTAKQAVAQRGMLAGIRDKMERCASTPGQRNMEKRAFLNDGAKRLKTGSWRVVRSLIQLLMVVENRPVDPGSIRRSHRPISFIKIKHRTRADDISCKTEY